MLKDPRYSILTLALVLTGCASKTDSGSDTPQRSDTGEETSWHCEQGTSTWSCKRLTIAEIQQREAERRSKRFGWSLPTATQTSTQLKSPQEKTEKVSAQQPIVSMTSAASAVAPKTATMEPEFKEAAKSALLQDLPGDYWAVQLIALDSQAKLRDFMRSTQLDELIDAIIKVNGRTWYVALLGVYSSREMAERAAAQRPAALQRYEPYIRSVASLQAAMTAADTL